MSGRGMSGTGILAGLVEAGEAAAGRATTAAGGRLAERLAAAFPEVAVVPQPEAVLLRAPGLRARAFGSRQRAADPQLMGLAAHFARGDGA
jgi:hypothetical protein